MIVLPEIAETLQTILNNNSNSDLEYKVETPGFHLDSIANSSTNKNFIPVFISSLGGTINPVPILKQTDGNVPVTFYFPVRLKDKMFLIQEYLNTQLVGKVVYWGELSGSILTNVSMPRYGEIQELDLIQFKKWVEANFKREIEIREPFITMEISIYLSAVGEEFMYGNNVKIKSLKFYYNGSSTAFFNDEEPVCIDRADIGSSEPAAQQLFSDTYSKGFGANAAYTKQLPLIVKNQEQYYDLLNICENTKDIQHLILELEEEIPISKEFTETVNGQEVTETRLLTIKHKYFITNYSRRTSLGQLLGVSFTLADYKE